MRNRLRAATLFSSGLAVLLMATMSRAQRFDCSESVKIALQETDLKCAQIIRNNACYGYGDVSATPVDGATNFVFQAPGDMVDVNQIKSLRLAALDPEGTSWGVTYLRIQANLPDTAAGQYVTLLMFGDTTLTNQPQPASTGSTPKSVVEAYYFQTGIGSPVCHQAPTSGLLIQAPKGAKTVHFTIDGVELGINSTVFIQAPSATRDHAPLTDTTQTPTLAPTVTPNSSAATDGPTLTITTIQGHVSVTVKGYTNVITNNQSAVVTLDKQAHTAAKRAVIGPPSDSMQALITLLTQDGDADLFLSTPDLAAIEPYGGSVGVGGPDTGGSVPPKETPRPDRPKKPHKD